jgi:hypothetical protein
MRSLGVLVAALAMRVGQCSVFLGFLMISVLVVVGSLVMMVGSRVVVGRCVVVMLD